MNKVQCAFDQASDWLEHVFSTWWGITIYFSLAPLTYLWWGWDGIDRYIYVTGAIVIFVLIGANRRDGKATHAKLDAISPLPDRLEEQAEEAIEEARNNK